MSNFIQNILQSTPLSVRVYADFGLTEISTKDLIDKYSGIYSINYLKSYLTNSEVRSDYSHTYSKNVVRVRKGVYIPFTI